MLDFVDEILERDGLMGGGVHGGILFTVGIETCLLLFVFLRLFQQEREMELLFIDFFLIIY